MASVLVGGLDETWSEPPGRAVRPEAASSVGPVAIHYGASLPPCLGTAIAPRRRARFRQALLGLSPNQGYAIPHRQLHGDHPIVPGNAVVDLANGASGLRVVAVVQHASAPERVVDGHQAAWRKTR